MLEVKGTQALLKKLEKAGVDLKNNLAATHRRLCHDIFVDLVKGTPQFTGNAASNWTIEFTGVSARPYSQTGEKGEVLAEGPAAYYKRTDPYSAGMDPTVSETLTRELSKIDKIRYNTKVTFKNTTPYASELEAGTGPSDGRGGTYDIRKVNELASYGGVAMIGYVDMKYKNLRNLKRRVK